MSKAALGFKGGQKNKIFIPIFARNSGLIQYTPVDGDPAKFFWAAGAKAGI